MSNTCVCTTSMSLTSRLAHLYLSTQCFLASPFVTACLHLLLLLIFNRSMEQTSFQTGPSLAGQRKKSSLLITSTTPPRHEWNRWSKWTLLPTKSEVLTLCPELVVKRNTTNYHPLPNPQNQFEINKVDPHHWAIDERTLTEKKNISKITECMIVKPC